MYNKWFYTTSCMSGRLKIIKKKKSERKDKVGVRVNISYSELMMMKIEEKRKELVLSVQTEGFLSSNAILKSQELDQLIFEYQQNRLYKH